jgi:hypothetical protein
MQYIPSRPARTSTSFYTAMNNHLRLTLSLILGLVASFTLSIIDSAVANPKQYFAPALVALGVLVIAQVAAETTTLGPGSIRTRRPKEGVPVAHVLEGDVKRSSKRNVRVAPAIGLAGCILIAIGKNLSTWRDWDGLGHHPTAGAIIVALGFTALAYGVFLRRRRRTRLGFGPQGITLESPDAAGYLHWDEASEYRTMKSGLLRGRFLVATPVPGSLHFLGPWELDESNNVIRICDLTSAGIDSDKVGAAIDYWRRQGSFDV